MPRSRLSSSSSARVSEEASDISCSPRNKVFRPMRKRGRKLQTFCGKVKRILLKKPFLAEQSTSSTPPLEQLFNYFSLSLFTRLHLRLGRPPRPDPSRGPRLPPPPGVPGRPHALLCRPDSRLREAVADFVILKVRRRRPRLRAGRRDRRGDAGAPLREAAAVERTGLDA